MHALLALSTKIPFAPNAFFAGLIVVGLCVIGVGLYRVRKEGR